MMFEKSLIIPVVLTLAGLYALSSVRIANSYTEESDDLPGFGEKCSLRICENTLRCTDGICKCSSPDYQIYDGSAGICRSLVSTKCRIGENLCVYGAKCTESRCQCKSSFVLSKNLTCQKNHGEDCSKKEDICASPFVCREGTCGCKNVDDVLRNSTRTCVRKVGYPCSGEGECASDSSCVFTGVEGERFQGKCVCNYGFKLNENSGSCLSTACKSNFFRPATEITSEAGAFPVGYESDGQLQFSCRVKINQTFAVGKAMFGSKRGWACWYEWNGVGQWLDVSGFEILAKPGNGVELTWLKRIYKSGMPDGALLADGRIQYVVRCNANIQGSKIVIPGKLVASDPIKVLFTWGYKAHNCKKYEVLTCSYKKK